MGTAEWVAIGLGIVVPAVGWLVSRVTRHDTEIAVMKATLPEHTTKLAVLEGLVTDLRGDMREVRNDLHRVARWVDDQDNRRHDRRSTDVQGDG